MVRLRERERSRGVQHHPKLSSAGLEEDECRRKFSQRVSINILLPTKKRADNANSFTKCIQDAAKKKLAVSTPRKKFAFASAETRIHVQFCMCNPHYC
ncbi:hypothetical protein RB195_001881 [Necator americanus]|uniref:Uncharacterized protein n=1 Tax=Necator americanus TaxID=51031 RepID=A0ABR1DGC3_NECAM